MKIRVTLEGEFIPLEGAGPAVELAVGDGMAADEVRSIMAAPLMDHAVADGEGAMLGRPVILGIMVEVAIEAVAIISAPVEVMEAAEVERTLADIVALGIPIALESMASVESSSSAASAMALISDSVAGAGFQSG